MNTGMQMLNAKKDTNYKIIKTDVPSGSYNIHIDRSFSKLADVLCDMGITGGRNVCIVTDSNVAPLYFGDVKNIVENSGAVVSQVVFPAGEQSKTLDTIKDFYGAFLDARLDRKSVVIALGGGVCGDMAGFAAATYMRGVDYVQIPTTLLSQVDSSVGGKTGVDFNGVKNIVGAFWQPRFVYINVSTLKTLPSEQFSSGMAEAVKHGLIYDEKYFEWMTKNAENIISLDADALTELVLNSCRIKSEVVAQDEKESGLREILNFGHTFGHAVESLCDFKLPHGHCVAIGMNAALFFSQNKGLIKQIQIDNAVDTLRSFGLPTTIPKEFKTFSVKDLYECMLKDKKATGGEMNLVLLDNLGSACKYKNASESDVMEAVKKIFED